MKTLSSKFPGWLLILALAISGARLAKAADPIVAELTITNVVIGATTVNLTVLDGGVGATSYLIQSTASLETPVWMQEGETISGGGAGAHSLSFARSDIGRKFFRALGLSGTASDLDGDGLSNEFEAGLGTNSMNPDTDGDGVSDGVEYSYGSNPRSAASRPGFTNLPRAEFAARTSTAVEGQGTHQIKVVFDKPFQGVLNYEILPLSTAAPAEDFEPLAGTVSVNGGEAFIPVVVVDDLEIRGSRKLVLQIERDPSSGYARGGSTQHILSIAENDSWWSGALADKYAQRNFRVKILRRGNTTQVVFGAGAGQDGLRVLASETAGAQSSLSEGVIAKGTWAGVVGADLPNRFRISTPPMPASTGGLFGAGTGLQRTIELICEPSATGPSRFHAIDKDRYVGAYTELLAFPANNGLGASNSGTFVLLRDLPPLAELSNPLATP